MDVSFDREADAVYIRFSDSEFEDTERVDEGTILDLDSKGELVGIEILDASNRVSEIDSLSIDFADRGKATAPS